MIFKKWITVLFVSLKKNWVLCLIMFIVGSCLSPDRAIAQEGYSIGRIDFKGNITFSAGLLAEKIVQKSHTGLDRLFFWNKPFLFSDNVLQRDVNRLVIFYQTEGFISVQVQFDVLTNDKKKRVDVIFRISEGEPVLIQNIRYTVTSPDEATKLMAVNFLESIKNNLPIQKGKRFRDILFQANNDYLKQHFINFGFPYIQVTSELHLQKSTSRVDINVDIHTGARCIFGNAIITGNKRISTKEIQKQIAAKKGKIFSEELLQRSQVQIYQLGVFQYVTVRTALDQKKENILPVQILVKETSSWSLKTGVGYSKEDRFRTFVEYRKFGIFTSAQRLIIRAKHSFLEPYNFDLKWLKPAFLRPRSNITLNPFVRREKEPGFTIDRNGGNLTFQRQFATYTNGYINYNYEQDHLRVSQATRLQALDGSAISIYDKSSVTIGLVRDHSEPPFSPNKGLYTAATVSYSGLGFYSVYHYLQVLLEGRHYQKITGKWIFATRLKIGGMGSTQQGEITPIAERFYAGGSYSVRGWLRSELGPKSAEGVPIGGNSLLEGSGELRFPIYKWLSGVSFMDFGNVWSKELDYPLSDLHYAAGLGLRFKTPIGPLRLDVAKPVFESPLPLRFHISVGQAF